jgi:hypothetical protein
MRNKAYYMPDEIISNLYTVGQEFQLADGTEYIGLYHRYTTNEVYTNAVWNSKTSVRLFPYVRVTKDARIYKTLKTELKTKFIPPQPYTCMVTNSDIANGYITRYFIKKVNESKIIEINESQYNLWNSSTIDRNLYDAIKLIWFITGDKTDKKIGTAVKKGVVTKNLSQIQYGKRKIPNLESILTDPLQYYTDTDFIVPVDINAR